MFSRKPRGPVVICEVCRKPIERTEALVLYGAILCGPSCWERMTSRGRRERRDSLRRQTPPRAGS